MTGPERERYLINHMFYFNLSSYEEKFICAWRGCSSPGKLYE